MAKGLRQTRNASPRAWQRMLSGRRLDLLDPSPLDIEIEDIAHGLARVARWNGQTVGEHAFSVAQHSLWSRRSRPICPPGLDPRWRLAALLHDAPEYVIGDMISPFKAALGLDYRTFEERLEPAIHLRFGLPAKPPQAGQGADQDAPTAPAPSSRPPSSPASARRSRWTCSARRRRATARRSSPCPRLRPRRATWSATTCWPRRRAWRPPRSRPRSTPSSADEP